MASALDKAIAATEDPAPAPRATVKVTLGTGDEVLINVPLDIDVAGRAGVAHYVLGPEFDALLRSRTGGARRPSILVPAQPLVRG